MPRGDKVRRRPPALRICACALILFPAGNKLPHAIRETLTTLGSHKPPTLFTMKTKLIPVLIFAAGLLGTALAAEPESAASPAVPAPAPDRTIFAPRLPSPAELTDIAAAQGQSIERIEQTASQVTVTTKTA